MKKIIGIFLMVVMVLLLLSGCGIPQEEHDTVVAERDAAKSQVASLQSDLAEAETEIETLENDLTATESDLTTTQSDLASAESDLAAAESRISSLQSDLDDAQGEIETLQGDYEVTSTELAEIKGVYPPGDFSSLDELQDWLLSNDVSERPASTTAENLYGKALEIQEDALMDGYLVSVNFSYDEATGMFYIACIAIIDGDIWWWDPETDEPIQYLYLGKVK